MNRLLKFPRAKAAPGRGYILGRVGRDATDSVETHDSDDDLDGIYIDRRPPPHQTLFEPDNHSIVVGTASSSDESNNDDPNAGRSSGDSPSKLLHIQKQQQQHLQQLYQISIAPPTTPGSPKKPTLNSSSSFTNLPKMATRYRFRDLLLGDFSFNDDGER